MSVDLCYASLLVFKRGKGERGGRGEERWKRLRTSLKRSGNTMPWERRRRDEKKEGKGGRKKEGGEIVNVLLTNPTSQHDAWGKRKREGKRRGGRLFHTYGQYDKEKAVLCATLLPFLTV